LPVFTYQLRVAELPPHPGWGCFRLAAAFLKIAAALLFFFFAFAVRAFAVARDAIVAITFRLSALKIFLTSQSASAPQLDRGEILLHGPDTITTLVFRWCDRAAGMDQRIAASRAPSDKSPVCLAERNRVVNYFLSFLGVLLIVAFINSLRLISFEHERATGLALVWFFAKASLLEAIKLYAVGVLLIRMLRPT